MDSKAWTCLHCSQRYAYTDQLKVKVSVPSMFIIQDAQFYSLTWFLPLSFRIPSPHSNVCRDSGITLQKKKKITVQIIIFFCVWFLGIIHAELVCVCVFGCSTLACRYGCIKPDHWFYSLSSWYRKFCTSNDFWFCGVARNLIFLQMCVHIFERIENRWEVCQPSRHQVIF